MKKFIVAFLVVFGLLAAVGLGLYSLQKPKETIPGRAATQSGTVGFRLTPGTSTISAGDSNIAIDLDIPSGTSVDGIQVVATFSGSVPSNLAFTPQTPAGMQMVINDLTKTGTTATLKLAFITQSPQSPYTTTSTYLGRFTFTAPASGQMTLTFDNTLTKVVSHGTALDIASLTPMQTYTFAVATSSPSPSPTSAPSTSCVRGNQSISLSPASQTGYKGQALTYTVTVTNNDDKNCTKADFSLSAILPFADWSANFAQGVLSISPQSSGSTTVIFTSSKNSPLGTLPVGVNSSGPKSSVVAAADYKVVETPTPKPTTKAKATPEVIVYKGTTASPSASPTERPILEASPTPEQQAATGIIANLPQAVIYGVGAFLLIVLFFILRALFGGKKENNPPKLTPPSVSTPETQGSVPTTPVGPQGPMPSISHSVEAPISNS